MVSQIAIPLKTYHMAKEVSSIAVAEDAIISKIYWVRGRKVTLDYDRSEMYAVETKQLKRQVRRNIDRFPDDFMFELTFEEYDALRSQIGTLKRGEHSKYAPMAFTEQGVAMLSNQRERRHKDYPAHRRVRPDILGSYSAESVRQNTGRDQQIRICG
jgi:hypothetical protein